VDRFEYRFDRLTKEIQAFFSLIQEYFNQVRWCAGAQAHLFACLWRSPSWIPTAPARQIRKLVDEEKEQKRQNERWLIPTNGVIALLLRAAYFLLTSALVISAFVTLTTRMYGRLGHLQRLLLGKCGRCGHLLPAPEGACPHTGSLPSAGFAGFTLLAIFIMWVRA
jgi:hypothetical protein